MKFEMSAFIVIGVLDFEQEVVRSSNILASGIACQNAFGERWRKSE